MHELVQSLKEKNVILFAGAGLSMNLGIPSWNELIGHIAGELGYDPEIFKTFGDHMLLAEYYYNKKGIGALRSWMDRQWHDSKIKISESSIHELIVNLNFPLIYTTNYDRWIEHAYDTFRNKDSYTKIVNVSDLAQIDSSKTQIIKFHGDFDDDNSIILTESSYFSRLNFETALDLKLRADSLGKSILFIGYSLSDINIRFLLYKLGKLWDEAGFVKNRPKSYIFLTRPNPVLEEALASKSIIPITSKFDNPKEGLIDFLNELYSASKR